LHGYIGGLLVVYVAWAGVSLIWADNPSLTLRRQVAYALLLLFSAGCVARMSLDTLSVFLAGIPALNLIPGVMAESAYGNLHPFASGNRFGGTVHPNLAGASLSLAVIVLGWWIWRKRGLVRFNLACGMVVLMVFALMTRSRTSLLALGAAVVFSVVIVIVRDYRNRLPSLMSALAVAVGLAGLGGLVVSNLARVDFVNTFRTVRDDGDVTELTGRVDLWRMCLIFAAERPLLGYGFDGFWSAKRIDIISEELHWPINQGHSAYLDQLLALGLPGAILYGLLLLSCLYACARRFIRGESCYGAPAALLLFVLICNFTESINILPTFPTFAYNLILLHIAFIRPAAPDDSAQPASWRIRALSGVVEGKA
jgi:exopolysaccharide production protein ExoQ